MTIADQTIVHDFDALRDEQFVVLTTFRRSGEAVPTTVWFAEANGVLYVTTNDGSGKVKRIINNPHVMIAPSDRIGNVHGPAMEARARLLAPEESQMAVAALRAKYGDMYDQLTAQMDRGSTFGHRVFMELTAPAR